VRDSVLVSDSAHLDCGLSLFAKPPDFPVGHAEHVLARLPFRLQHVALRPRGSVRRAVPGASRQPTAGRRQPAGGRQQAACGRWWPAAGSRRCGGGPRTSWKTRTRIRLATLCRLQAPTHPGDENAFASRRAACADAPARRQVVEHRAVLQEPLTLLHLLRVQRPRRHRHSRHAACRRAAASAVPALAGSGGHRRVLALRRQRRGPATPTRSSGPAGEHFLFMIIMIGRLSRELRAVREHAGR